MFTYAEAETVLARIHGADPIAQRGAFRGRLKHLKRLGVPIGSAPGRGKKILYSMDQIYEWAFCLELAEFGLDPTLIVSIVKSNIDTILTQGFHVAVKSIADSADHGAKINQNDRYFYFEPSVMTQSLSTSSVGIFPDLGAIGFGTLAEALNENTNRLGLINLTKLTWTIEVGISYLDRRAVNE